MKLDLNALKKLDWLDLLLRYGDKALVGIAALVLLWAMWKAVAALRQVPDVSPTELTALANNVRSRLNQSNVTPELLAEAGVKNPDFTGLVQELSREVNPNLVADADLFYRFLDFGGILREQPEIFAPEELYVAAGRGGLLLYELDEQGNKIPATVKKKTTRPKKRRRRASRRRVSTDDASMMGGMGEMGYGGYGGDMMEGMMGYPGMGMGGYPGMGMGGYPGMGGGYPGMGGMEEGMAEGMAGPAPSRPASRPRARGGADSRRIAGLKSRTEEEEKKEDTEQTGTTTAQQYEMHPRGFRWVVITAVYPHKKQLEEYRRALKAAEAPEYVRVVVERRMLQSDGTFSDWQPVDTRPNAWIAKRRVGVEEELPVLQPYLLDGLVEKLPRLAYGAWEYVDHVMAIEAAGQKPEEVARQAQGQQQGGPFGPGGMPGTGSEEEMYGMGGSGYPGMMGGNMPPGMGGMGGMEGAMEGAAGYPGMGGAGGYPGMGPGGMPGPMMGGGAAAGATGQGGQNGQQFAPPGSAAQEQKRYIEVEYVQVRFIDYTVQAGRTYQYRMKVVVKNPNYNRPDVAEDAYRKPEFLEGPWSKPSRPVYVGKDVEYYLVNAKFNERTGMPRGVFEVHRWDNETGDWYCSTFEVVPGAPVGNQRKIKILTWEEEVKEELVDFNTGAVLLDVVGGRQRFQENGTTYSYEEPVQALVVTREGDLIWRALTDDLENPIRKERAEYCAEIREIIRELERGSIEAETPLGTGLGGFNTPQGTGSRIPGRRNQ